MERGGMGGICNSASAGALGFACLRHAGRLPAVSQLQRHTACALMSRVRDSQVQGHGTYICWPRVLGAEVLWLSDTWSVLRKCKS